MFFFHLRILHIEHKKYLIQWNGKCWFFIFSCFSSWRKISLIDLNGMEDAHMLRAEQTYTHRERLREKNICSQRITTSCRMQESPSNVHRWWKCYFFFWSPLHQSQASNKNWLNIVSIKIFAVRRSKKGFYYVFLYI